MKRSGNGKEYELKETLLAVRDVRLELGGNLILDRVNVEVRNITRPGMSQGQVIGCLGPSGIGKTQLFWTLAGLQQPTSGEVILNGGTKVERGMVGVVSQKYPIFDRRTVMSNLMVAARQKGHTATEARERATAMLERFGIADTRNLYQSQISGGQRQRVAIAQQLLCSEHFLLMDEPFSGLDCIAKANVRDFIGEVSRADDLNTTIITTHVIEPVTAIADTIWLMGRDRDAAGNPIPGAHIVKSFDLVEMGLAWEPGIERTPRFREFVGMLEYEEFPKL